MIEYDSKLYVIDATHFILHKMATATFTQPREKIKGVDPPKNKKYHGLTTSVKAIPYYFSEVGNINNDWFLSKKCVF